MKGWARLYTRLYISMPGLSPQSSYVAVLLYEAALRMNADRVG